MIKTIAVGFLAGISITGPVRADDVARRLHESAHALTDLVQQARLDAPVQAAAARFESAVSEYRLCRRERSRSGCATELADVKDSWRFVRNGLDGEDAAYPTVYDQYQLTGGALQALVGANHGGGGGGGGPHPGPAPVPHPQPQPVPHPEPHPGPYPGPHPEPHPGPYPGPNPHPHPVPPPYPYPHPHPVPPYPNPQPGELFVYGSANGLDFEFVDYTPEGIEGECMNWGADNAVSVVSELIVNGQALDVGPDGAALEDACATIASYAY
jgi:hypothetical protein